MSVDGEAVRLRTEADEPGWEVDPDDDWGVAVITTVGRQLQLRRAAAGMRAGEFGAAVGYGEDLVYKIEGGKRPQPAAISPQPSAVSRQPSAVSRQPSAVSRQPSAVSRQPSAVRHTTCVTQTSPATVHR